MNHKDEFQLSLQKKVSNFNHFWSAQVARNMNVKEIGRQREDVADKSKTKIAPKT